VPCILSGAFCVVMLGVILLSDVILDVIMLSTVMLGVIMLSAAMLNVASPQILLCYAICSEKMKPSRTPTMGIKEERQ